MVYPRYAVSRVILFGEEFWKTFRKPLLIMFIAFWIIYAAWIMIGQVWLVEKRMAERRIEQKYEQKMQNMQKAEAVQATPSRKKKGN